MAAAVGMEENLSNYVLLACVLFPNFNFYFFL